MNRIKIILLTILCCWLQPCWAHPITLNHIAILPIPTKGAIVNITSTKPLQTKLLQSHGRSIVWLEHAKLAPTLYTPQKVLKPAFFLKPVPYRVKVVENSAGTQLYFESKHPLKLWLTTSQNQFLEKAGEELPLYLQWPSVKTPAKINFQVLLGDASNDYDANHLDKAVQKMEIIFNGLPHPPQMLYQLLGALYLHQNQWVKALVLYGQGAHDYPNVLGIRYSALLYQAHQPQNAIQVLKKTRLSKSLSLETDGEIDYMLGSLYLETHAYSQALSSLQAAANTFFQSPVVLYNLAIAYEGNNDLQLAFQTYLDALPYAHGDLADMIQAQIHRLK